MNTDNVQVVLKAFGVSARNIKKPPDAKLASVYIIDDDYVLRSRGSLEHTPALYEAERERLAAVAALTGYSFPNYQNSRDGKAYVVDNGSFWTLHRLIPGRTLGNWYELHKVPSQADKQVLTALHRLHDDTKGRFAEEKLSRTFLPDRIELLLEDAPVFLHERSVRRLVASFQRVKGASERYPATEACFVHGDFHHGNIIVNQGDVVGFIDLDWCRAGLPLEDLGFTMMMLLRDYNTWSPAFRRQRYEELLSLYRYNGDVSLLNDYIILYALFDCDCFKNAGFEKAADFHDYQIAFLEGLCRDLVPL